MMRTWTVLNYIFIAFSLGVWFCFIVLNDAVISPTFRGVARPPPLVPVGTLLFGEKGY